MRNKKVFFSNLVKRDSEYIIVLLLLARFVFDFPSMYSLVLDTKSVLIISACRTDLPPQAARDSYHIMA